MTSRRWLMASVLLAVVSASPAAGQRLITMDDVMTIRSLRDPQFSPDGARVVYTVGEVDMKANVDRASLWLVSAAGGAPRRLTHQAASDRMPRWSPDGGSLAFLSDRDGEDERGNRVSGRAQVWLLAMSGGEARQLTRSPTSVTEFAWAPDGKRLVFGAAALPPDHEQREKRRKEGYDAIVSGDHRMGHLWTVEVLTGVTSRLTSGDFHASEAAWSPKGDLIAFVSRPTPNANEQLLSDLFVVPAGGGAPVKVVTNEGPDFAPAWSPDGSQIAYLSNQRRQSSGAHNVIMVVAASGGPARAVLRGFEYSVDGAQWTSDGGSLYFHAGTRTEAHVFTVAAAGGAAKAVTGGAAVHGAFDVSHDGTRVAYLRQDATSPDDLWVSAAGGANPVRLTHLNPQLAEVKLASTEVTRWKGPLGWEIEGVLVRPPDFQPGRRYPLIVEAHGGPHGAQTVGFNPMWQYFAARGYAVLAPNFRGSSGYSQAFVDADRNDWGGNDYLDIMAGVDAVVASGLADPERLGVEGWSYGGFMTSWIIGHTDRFKAAVVGAGVTNLQSFYGTTDIQRFIEWEFNGFPWDNAVAIRDHSPVNFAHKAKTPTLILHGNDDVRVPVEQGEQLFMILRKAGVTVDFARFPREGHGLREPAHRRDRYERTVGWFERFMPAR